jgi:hypothetical protein
VNVSLLDISVSRLSFSFLDYLKPSSPMKMSYQRGPTGVMGAINNHTPFANAPPPAYNADSAASLGNGQISGQGRINSPEAASTSTTFPAVEGGSPRLTSHECERESNSAHFPPISHPHLFPFSFPLYIQYNRQLC